MYTDIYQPTYNMPACLYRAGMVAAVSRVTKGWVGFRKTAAVTQKVKNQSTQNISELHGDGDNGNTAITAVFLPWYWG